MFPNEKVTLEEASLSRATQEPLNWRSWGLNPGTLASKAELQPFLFGVSVSSKPGCLPSCLPKLILAHPRWQLRVLLGML